MSNFFHKLFNPHCQHCIDERHEARVCPSCETLKTQLEMVNYEKNRLLDRLLEKPAPEPVKEPPQITQPRNIPWSVRRQMLEAEDREKAKLMRAAPKPAATEVGVRAVEDLEKEMDLVSNQRETEH